MYKYLATLMVILMAMCTASADNVSSVGLPIEMNVTSHVIDPPVIVIWEPAIGDYIRLTDVINISFRVTSDIPIKSAHVTIRQVGKAWPLTTLLHMERGHAMWDTREFNAGAYLVDVTVTDEMNISATETVDVYLDDIKPADYGAYGLEYQMSYYTAEPTVPE